MFSRVLPLLSLAAVCAGIAPAQAPRACTVSSAPTTVRSLGVAEIVGDVLLSCGGGAGLTAGTPLPLYTVTATLSAASGNRVFVGGYTDALLLVGEPSAASQFPCTLDACSGVAGAPFGNASGENRNVFAGRLTGPNSISWTLPLDGGAQTLRLVNLRVNASTLAGQGPSLPAPTVGASIAVAGPGASVVNPNVTVAALNPGLDFNVRSGDGNATVRLNNNAVVNSPVGAESDFQFSLRVTETTPFAWKSRSAAATSVDPTAVQTQSRPGQSTEARFLLSETGYHNQAFPAFNGLSAAGLGDSGTRLVARFANLPANVRLFVSTTPIAEFTSGATARLITTDANGVGFFSPAPVSALIRGGTVGVAELPVSEGRATAVWEVLDPTAEIDRLNFGGFLSYNVAVPDATVTVQVMLGPISPTGTVSTGPKFALPATTPASAAILGNGGTGGGIQPPPTGGGSFAVSVPAALPAATAGQAYPAFALATTPASPGAVWTIIEGTFPPGMTLANNGVIAGTPLFPGTYSFVVRVQNTFAQTATARLTLFVRSSQISVSAIGIINGTVGTVLTPVALVSTGGNPPLRWFAQTERIPPGLTLSEGGILSGIPSVEGLYSLPVFVQDSTGATAQATATFSVTGFLRIATPSPFPVVPPGFAYRQVLEAAGGTAPYRWSLVSGQLPFGLALDSSGVITGVAPAAARGAFVLQVTDGAGRAARRSYTIELAGNGTGLDRVRVQPEGLRFTGSQPQLLRLTADSAQSTTLQVSVMTENGGNWLSADRTDLGVNSESPAHVVVRASTENMPEGSYQGHVMLRAGGSSKLIPVSLTVTTRPLLVVPAALAFSASEAGPATPRQTVRVLGGRQAFNWNAAASVPWIVLSRATGMAGDTFEVSANQAGLAPGEHFGEVTVAGAGAAPQTLTVMLRVIASGTIPPISLNTGGVLLRPGNASTGLTVTNPFAAPFRYFVSRDFGDAFQWFNVNPPSEELPPGAPRALTLEARPAPSAGVRRGVLSLAFGGAALRQVEVASIEPGASCRATQLVTVLGTPEIDEPLVIGQPVAVRAMVADDCGALPADAAVSLLTPDGGVPLAPLGDGTWAGTWKPGAGATAGPWTLTLAARSGNLEGASSRTVNVSESPLPTITSVVTGGSFSRYRAVAPGSFITVLGSGLADATLHLDGRMLETVFTSPSQINARLPGIVAAPQSYALVARRGGQVSVPEPVPVALLSPDVFVIAQPGGRLQGAITDPAFRLVDQANPAAPGDVIVVFLTGLGGSPNAPVTVSVAGTAAGVLGVAPSPGFPGLFQVAARLSAATPAQPDAPVIVTAGGLSSSPVVIATRR